MPAQPLVLRALAYALSHLILYLESGDPASAEAVLEEALDLFDYEAGQDCVLATGVVAVVLDASDEEKIASDPRILSERMRQAEDRCVAAMPVDWAGIEREAHR